MILFLSACGDGQRLPPPTNPPGGLSRTAPAGTWEQDCGRPPGCPDDGLDPAWCLTDPSPFRPTWMEEEVVSVTVDEAAIAALGLSPGTWWTAWSDGVSCERAVAMFVVADEVTP